MAAVVTAVATREKGGVFNARPPRSRFHEIAARIARRMQPAIAKAFLVAVERLIAQIDDAALLSALASKNPHLIEAAIASGGSLSEILLNGREIENAMLRTSTLTGHAGADVLSGATGVEVRFNHRNPRVVLYARTQAGALIQGITEDVRDAIRSVIASGADLGATTAQQARVIREVVGLTPNHARAPLSLADELRAGRFTSSRRLSAADKASIRSRIAAGTVDEAFIEKMQGKYTSSLRNYRARMIARTETIRSANHGTVEGWKQGIEQGALPKTTRRMWLVTPDERLCEICAPIPGMNEEGVGVDELFNTPVGPVPGPPVKPHCRCGQGLSFGLRPGLL